MIKHFTFQRIELREKLIVGITILLIIWLVLSPTLVEAFSGLGGYISEKLLGDGTNEALHLGDGTNELCVLGSGPAITTLEATNVKMDGGGTATLRGNITNLNGMPRADCWFTWGYSAGSLSNSTPVVTVTATGEQSATITGFDTKQDVFYRFWASTDGTLSGGVRSFTKADVGFNLLDILLLVIISAIICITVFKLMSNPVVALTAAIIGIIAFVIIQTLLQSM